MLQVGPLKEYLYKSSVSVRGFYWRAGYQMFIDHPLTGVGVDRYGVYFKQYREVQYPLNYGFSLNSTNAHNVPIQLFATGGIFVGIFYLLTISFIFYRGIYAIKKFAGSVRRNIFCLAYISSTINNFNRQHRIKCLGLDTRWRNYWTFNL